jgi:O-antigen/teichoic acid export membrane protein
MQETGARVAKNAGILIAAEVMSRTLGMLVIIVAARILGAKNFGVLAFAAAFTQIFGIIVQFGFRTLVTREVARDQSRAPRMMGSILLLQSVLAVIAFIIMIVVLRVLDPGDVKTQLTHIAALSIIMESLRFHLTAYFRARQATKYEALVRFFFSFARAILIVGILFLGYGVFAYMITELIAGVASLILCFYLVRSRIARPSFAFQPQAWTTLLRAALPFAVSSGLVILYVRSATIILSLTAGDEITGWYSAATRFFTLFAFVPRSMMVAVLPVMSQQSVQRDSAMSLLKSFSRSFRFLFMLALPLALGMGILAQPLISLLYGDQFLAAVPAMQILMLALVLSFLNWAGTYSLISLNRERTVLGIAAISLVVNLAANLVLIPYLGHVGAAVTSVLSEGVVLVLQLRILRQELGSLRVWRTLMKPTLAGVAMTCLLIAFQHTNVMMLVVPAGIVYLGALLLLRAFDATELEVFRTVLPARLKWLSLGQGEDSRCT